MRVSSPTQTVAQSLTNLVTADGASGGFIKDAQAGSLPATATNDSATAGTVGEYISATLASGSAVSLTSATAKTVTSISLTAGDWDVNGNIAIVGAATTTMTVAIAAINTTTDTLPTIPGGGGYTQEAGTLGTQTTQVLDVGPMRISLSATTTVYLVASATFAVSTCTAYGFIGARRAR